MIPIRLETHRFADGYEYGRPDAPGFLTPRSKRKSPLVVEAVDLENPLAVRFANCRTAEDIVSFMDRYGDEGGVSPERLLNDADDMRSWIINLLMIGPAGHPPPFNDSYWVVGDETTETVLTYVGGLPKVMLLATTIRGFMKLETAAAFEAGAKAVECSHCSKLFLIGPFTGRRSHARFCSDRCRVAAMRVRNALKEG